MRDIKSGDIVKVKSGGPVMTVRRREISFSYVTCGEDVAICQWFSGDVLNTQAIPLSILEIYTK